MDRNILAATFLILALASPACARQQADLTGPTITDITTSNDTLVISDCLSTSVTISARVTDETGVAKVILWFHAGSEQPFKSITMGLQDDRYKGILRGEDLFGQKYGVLEFHITAEDTHGNNSTSPTDKSIQFLPCVTNN